MKSSSEKTVGSCWYDKLSLNETDSVRANSAFDWAEEKLIKLYTQQSIESQKCLYSRIFRGYFDLENKTKIEEYFTKGRKLFHSREDNEYSENTEDHIWLGKDDFVALSFSSENNVAVEIHTHEQKFLLDAQEFMSKILTKRSKDNLGKAHVLAQGFDGLSTKEVGTVGIPLALENYNSEVREGLEEIIKDLKSILPNGKLAIFEGPPGTGKTFLIRQLISEIPTAFFVIIPPAMVAQLGDPSIIPVLLRLKSHDDDMSDEDLLLENSSQNADVSNPIVLIIEDADDVLVKRENGNMAAISTVLNMTSGILGDLLDIRIIATTNRVKGDLDDALTRDGRMSYHLNVGPLSYDEANSVYKRLMNDAEAQYKGDLDGNNKALLASVYKEAKRKGYRHESDNAGKVRTNIKTPVKRKLGF